MGPSGKKLLIARIEAAVRYHHLPVVPATHRALLSVEWREGPDGLLLMTKRGWSQADLARKANLPPGTLSAITAPICETSKFEDPE